MDTKLHLGDKIEEDSTLVEEQMNDAMAEEFFRHDIPGLYITTTPTDNGSQTTVVKHDTANDDVYLVWDSSWDPTHQSLSQTKKLDFPPSVRSHGTIIATGELDQTVSIIYSIPGGDVHKDDAFIQKHARENDPRDSPGVLKTPIPQHEDDDEESEEDDDETAAAALASAAAAVADDTLLLYVHEHAAVASTLTFSPDGNIIHLTPIPTPTSTTKKPKEPKKLQLTNSATNAPILVQYYRHARGYTLRFNTCGHTTEKNRIALPWKECHVHFPPDRWTTGFHYASSTQDYATGAYGKYDDQRAQHNALVFPRFMDELEKLLKGEKEKRGKKKTKAGVKREGEGVLCIRMWRKEGVELVDNGLVGGMGKEMERAGEAEEEKKGEADERGEGERME